MKTLDEVINALEICTNPEIIVGRCEKCPYDDKCWDERGRDIDKLDALYYLKEYRSDMLMYEANQKYWEDELMQKIKDFGDAKDRYIKRLKELDIGTLNTPLTWDELKTMQGKPVWVEGVEIVIGGSIPVQDWYLIEWISDDDFEAVLRDRHGNQMIYHRNGDWQAYRKEKK